MTTQTAMFDAPPAPNFELDQWFTPPDLARQFVEWCILSSDHWVLEPSAGNGALITAMDSHIHVTAVELDPFKVTGLRAEHGGSPFVDLYEANFLTWQHPNAVDGHYFDLAIMNPPYSTVPSIDAMFVERASRMCTRVCAIVRAIWFNGVERKRICHDHVKYTRVHFLTRRPNFGGDHGAKTDFIFVECHRREAGDSDEHSPVVTIG